MSPKRVQRKRDKGWKLPPNTVIVTRPTKWGNPFNVTRTRAAGDAVFHYWLYIDAMSAEKREEFLAPLRGKDLACYCAAGQVCHADLLLKLANAEIQQP